MHACTYAQTNTHACARARARMYTRAHKQAHTNSARTRTHKHTRMYTRAHAEKDNSSRMVVEWIQTRRTLRAWQIIPRKAQGLQATDVTPVYRLI